MTLPFDQPSPMFVVLDKRQAWGAYLADRLVDPDRNGDKEGQLGRLAIRHLDDLEALDSCLVGNQMPVGLLLASDFVALDELVAFLRQHAGRCHTLLLIASHDHNDDIERLLHECGAHYVLRSMTDVFAIVGCLRRFFARAGATMHSRTN